MKNFAELVHRLLGLLDDERTGKDSQDERDSAIEMKAIFQEIESEWTWT